MSKDSPAKERWHSKEEGTEEKIYSYLFSMKFILTLVLMLALIYDDFDIDVDVLIYWYSMIPQPMRGGIARRNELK